VDPGAIAATYKDGILKVGLPGLTTPRPRRPRPECRSPST